MHKGVSVFVRVCVCACVYVCVYVCVCVLPSSTFVQELNQRQWDLIWELGATSVPIEMQGIMGNDCSRICHGKGNLHFNISHNARSYMLSPIHSEHATEAPDNSFFYASEVH